MNCGAFEELLALYVEGDLSGPEDRQVEAHLETCQGCRAFVVEFRESQRAVKCLRQEEIEARVFEQVRERVMERIARPRALPGWAWALAAAACLLVLVVWLYPRRSEEPPPLPKWVVQAPPLERPPEVALPVQRRHRRVTARTQARMPVLPVIKMVTDDPDVVIYWITDQNGESQ